MNGTFWIRPNVGVCGASKGDGGGFISVTVPTKRVVRRPQRHIKGRNLRFRGVLRSPLDSVLAQTGLRVALGREVNSKSIGLSVDRFMRE